MTAQGPNAERELLSVLARARDLDRRVARALASPGHADSSSADLTMVSRRLRSSVIRPLAEALAQLRPAQPSDLTDSTKSGGGAEDPTPMLSSESLGDASWALAQDATTLQLDASVPLMVREAAAALQDLACELADTDGANGVAARLQQFKVIQAGLPAGIQAHADGPYVMTNCERLFNWLGEPVPVRPLMALCRCGRSATKPFCDGTHAEIQFTDQKDPKRVPDRRATYVGQQITILDNRGTCAHSGFCTDRLATVFHLGAEPFITPSGARQDDIIRAVRACPSGALSFAIDGREAREQVDQDRPPTVEVSKDGPYRVTGGLRFIDSHGDAELINDGASRETCAVSIASGS